MHKLGRLRYGGKRNYVEKIDAQWQLDLADLQAISRKNKGARYLLTKIYVFYEYECVEAVKSKDAMDVT